jgi:hypothetical protein
MTNRNAAIQAVAAAVATQEAEPDTAEWEVSYQRALIEIAELGEIPGSDAEVDNFRLR